MIRTAEQLTPVEEKHWNKLVDEFTSFLEGKALRQEMPGAKATRFKHVVINVGTALASSVRLRFQSRKFEETRATEGLTIDL